MKQLSLKDYQSEAGLDAWVAAVGVVNASVPRAGIATSLQFFQRYMPLLSVTLAVSFLRGFDLSKRVSEVTLTPGERLIAYRGPAESQFKTFYTRSGRSLWNVGVNPAGRRFVTFRVRIPLTALQSFASPAKDIWTQAGIGYLAAGGATQLIIPESYRALLIADDSSATLP
jgi:hypothetical protein